jgi:hypothetical protein
MMILQPQLKALLVAASPFLRTQALKALIWVRWLLSQRVRAEGADVSGSWCRIMRRYVRCLWLSWIAGHSRRNLSVVHNLSLSSSLFVVEIRSFPLILCCALSSEPFSSSLLSLSLSLSLSGSLSVLWSDRSGTELFVALRARVLREPALSKV